MVLFTRLSIKMFRLLQQFVHFSTILYAAIYASFSPLYTGFIHCAGQNQPSLPHLVYTQLSNAMTNYKWCQ